MLSTVNTFGRPMESRGHLLIYTMVLLQCSGALGADKVHFSQRLQNSNDGRTSVYTFEWMAQICITDCVDACKSTKACEYINYYVRTHACTLVRTNDVINNDILALVERKPGYMFGNKSEWTTDAFAKCDACNSYGKCTDEQSGCRNSGCGMPRIGGFKGNRFSNGSMVLRNCAAVIQQILHKDVLTPSVCGEDGDWLDQYKCMPYWNGSYYYLQTGMMNWNESKIHCESMSAHLLDICSEEEDMFIAEWTLGVWLWVGANDMEEEGNFIWSDGSAVSDGYTNWGFNNPNNYDAQEHCMIIKQKRSKHFWNDFKCHLSLGSICEFD